MTGLILLLVRLVFRRYEQGKFCKFFDSFQQLLKLRRFYVVRCFTLVAGILYFNHFLFLHATFLLQLSRPIAQR